MKTIFHEILFAKFTLAVFVCTVTLLNNAVYFLCFFCEELLYLLLLCEVIFFHSTTCDQFSYNGK